MKNENDVVNIRDFMNHETRISLVEHAIIRIENKIDKLESKLESRFIMLVGLIITSIILPVVLHSLKLV